MLFFTKKQKTKNKRTFAVYDNNNVASGLAEYQTGETVGVAHGGTGAVTFTKNEEIHMILN